MKKTLAVLVFMISAFGGRAALQVSPQTQLTTGLPSSALRWRSIGPANTGGRVTAVEGIAGDPTTFYVGAADGGIWKTVNAGTTFRPLFDNQTTLSIGALAVAPSDVNVIYAGTGEGNPRNSVSFGDGVYRSTDAGETWAHLGLADTDPERVRWAAPRRRRTCAQGATRPCPDEDGSKRVSRSLGTPVQ